MKRKIMFLVVAIVVVLVVVVAIYLVINNTTNIAADDNNVTPTSLEQGKLIKGLSGKIVMDLVDKKGNPRKQSTYSLGALNTYGPKLTRAPLCIKEIYSSFSFNKLKKKMVFTALMDKKTGQTDKDVIRSRQIFVSDIVDGEIFTAPSYSPGQITDHDGAYKQMPVLSPNAKNVLYMAQVKPVLGVVNTSAWNIYLASVVDVKTIEELPAVKSIVAGTYPKWVNDSSFLYISDDGLRLFSISDKSNTLIWGLNNSKALSNMRLDLSDDKKYIAWSFPDAGKMWVLNVKDWGVGRTAPRVAFFGEVNIHGFWPVFSPDSKYIVMQVVDWGDRALKLKNNPKPRLNIWALQDGAGLKKVDWEFNLDAFDQEYMFITDWR